MKRWYITPSTNLLIDTETDSAIHIQDEYTNMNCCYIAPEDCKIKFACNKSCDNQGDEKEYNVKKGQLVFTFYRADLPNQLIILDSKELIENIEFRKNEEQKAKEEWAANKVCDGCGTNCKD